MLDEPVCYLRGAKWSQVQSHQDAGNDNVRDCQGQQDLPAESHKLVITEARQRAASPDIQKDKEKNLYAKPKYRNKRSEYGRDRKARDPRDTLEATVASAKKEQRANSGRSNSVGVLCPQEHGQADDALC